MSWLSDYREDVRRCTNYSRGSGFTQLLLQQGLWALLQYRIAAAVYNGRLPSRLKKFVLLAFWPWQKIIEVSTGISLPYSAVVGPGLFIAHFGNVIVNSRAVLGRGCNLSPGVTIGISGRGERRGVPVIGDRVYFGVNSVVVGPIKVGNDVVIGANSLVHIDVPSNCTMLGVPAVIINNRGSQEYIDADPYLRR